MKVIYSMFFLTVVLQARSPVFETDLWPGEGVPQFEALSKELRLHERPLSSSRITSTLMVSPGQSVDYDDTLYRTVESGRIEVLESSEIEARLIGKVNRLTKSDYYSNKFKTVKRELQLKMIIEYIQYRAEGACFLGIDGQVLNMFCPGDHDPKFQILSEPKTEWWIHVVLGTSSGWIQVSDSTVKDVR
jgi:hypothetical protein